MLTFNIMLGYQASHSETSCDFKKKFFFSIRLIDPISGNTFDAKPKKIRVFIYILFICQWHFRPPWLTSNIHKASCVLPLVNLQLYSAASLLTPYSFTLAVSYKSVDKILWCCHTTETSLVELFHGAIYFLGFFKMKFEFLWIFLILWLVVVEALKKVMWCIVSFQKISIPPTP